MSTLGRRHPWVSNNVAETIGNTFRFMRESALEKLLEHAKLGLSQSIEAASGRQRTSSADQEAHLHHYPLG